MDIAVRRDPPLHHPMSYMTRTLQIVLLFVPFMSKAADSLQTRMLLCQNWQFKEGSTYMDFALFANDSCQHYHPKYQKGVWRFSYSSATLYLGHPPQQRRMTLLRVNQDSLTLQEYPNRKSITFTKHMALVDAAPIDPKILYRTWRIYKKETFDSKGHTVATTMLDTVSMVFLSSGKGVLCHGTENYSDLFLWNISHDSHDLFSAQPSTKLSEETLIIFLTGSLKALRFARKSSNGLILESYAHSRCDNTGMRLYLK